MIILCIDTIKKKAAPPLLQGLGGFDVYSLISTSAEMSFSELQLWSQWNNLIVAPKPTDAWTRCCKFYEKMQLLLGVVIEPPIHDFFTHP